MCGILNVCSKHVVFAVSIVLQRVHNMTLDISLCCVARVLTLVAMQHDARIDSDSILGFPVLRPCRWLQKKKKKLVWSCFARPKLDAMQRDI